jgi:polar amino acid transport system ATP-binding protein
VQGLHKYFGDNEVLKGIDFHVDNGEVVCVIGPSGSGQVDAAALRQPAGDARPRARSSSRETRSPIPDADVDKLRSRIGMVFQSLTSSRT